jgi:hypothetical protein
VDLFYLTEAERPSDTAMDAAISDALKLVLERSQADA